MHCRLSRRPGVRHRSFHPLIAVADRLRVVAVRGTPPDSQAAPRNGDHHAAHTLTRCPVRPSHGRAIPAAGSALRARPDLRPALARCRRQSCFAHAPREQVGGEAFARERVGIGGVGVRSRRRPGRAQRRAPASPRSPRAANRHTAPHGRPIGGRLRSPCETQAVRRHRPAALRAAPSAPRRHGDGDARRVGSRAASAGGLRSSGRRAPRPADLRDRVALAQGSEPVRPAPPCLEHARRGRGHDRAGCSVVAVGCPRRPRRWPSRRGQRGGSSRAMGRDNL